MINADKETEQTFWDDHKDLSATQLTSINPKNMSQQYRLPVSTICILIDQLRRKCLPRLTSIEDVPKMTHIKAPVVDIGFTPALETEELIGLLRERAKR